MSAFKRIPIPGTANAKRISNCSGITAYEELRASGAKIGVLGYPLNDRKVVLDPQLAKHLLVTKEFSSRVNSPDPAVDGWFFGLDGRDHRQIRKVVNSLWGRYAQRLPIAEMVCSQIDLIKGRPDFDLVKDIIWPLAGSIGDYIVGFNDGERESYLQMTSEGPRQVNDLLEPFRSAVARQRGGAGTSFICCAPTMEKDAKSLEWPDSVWVGVLASFRIASQAPLTQLISFVFYYLLTEAGSGWLSESRPCPDEAEIYNMLAKLPSNNLGIWRVVSDDVVVDGINFVAGEVVHIAGISNASNVCVESDNLRLKDGANLGLPFGHGPHSCPAKNLSISVIRECINQLTNSGGDLKFRLADPNQVTFVDDLAAFFPVSQPCVWIK